MRYRVVRAYIREGTGGRVEVGAIVELDPASRLVRNGNVVPLEAPPPPLPVAISSVPPVLAADVTAEVPPPPELLAEATPPAEPEVDVPVRPSRRRR